jgi:hypothetical protein
MSVEPHIGTLKMDGAKLRALLPGVPIIESPFFEEVVASSNIDAETTRIAKHKRLSRLSLPCSQRDGFLRLR